MALRMCSAFCTVVVLMIDRLFPLDIIVDSCITAGPNERAENEKRMKEMRTSSKGGNHQQKLSGHGAIFLMSVVR